MLEGQRGTNGGAVDHRGDEKALETAQDDQALLEAMMRSDRAVSTPGAATSVRTPPPPPAGYLSRKLTSLVGPGVTPLPIGQVATVFFVQLCEGAQVNVLFPFLVFMVEDLGCSHAQLGTYSGILAASFCAAQFLSSVFIGRLSDRIGRKSTILAGLLGSALSILVFGAAKTYTAAVAGRMISGLLNGNIATLKSFLGEITDDTNSGLAFSLLSLGWGMGVVFAPIVGGLLAKPAEQPGIIGQIFQHSQFFKEYPYLLPCLVVACFQLVTVLLTLVIMEEPRRGSYGRPRGKFGKKYVELTEGKRRPLSRHSCTQLNDGEHEDDGDPDAERLDTQSTPRSTACSQRSSCEACYDRVSLTDQHECHVKGSTDQDVDDKDEEVEVLRGYMYDEDMKGTLALATSEENEEAVLVDTTKLRDMIRTNTEDTYPESLEDFDEGGDVDVGEEKGRRSRLGGGCAGGKADGHPLCTKSLLLAVLAYGLVSMTYICFEETLPLLCKLSVREGGLGFNSEQIGSLLSISGVCLITFGIALYPRIQQQLGYFKCLMIGLCGQIPLFIIWPLLPLLVPYRTMLWVCLSCAIAFKALLASFSFTSVMVMINNAVPREHLGAAHGFGQSCASLARAIGPAVGGVLWSMGLGSGFLWLNWLVMLLLTIGTMAVYLILPRTLEHSYGAGGTVKTGFDRVHVVEAV